MFEFKISAREPQSKARTGEFITPHGILQTPALAIVGTEGQIRGVSADVAKKLPLNYTIVNTFHIWTKGIVEKIRTTNTIDSGSEIPVEAGNQSGMTSTTRSYPTVHQYGGFPNVVASDSGGFQVFSLGFGSTHKVGKHAKIPIADKPSTNNAQTFDIQNPLKITEEGVTFVWNNAEVTLTPEKSMELQHQIGADIIFAFDECTSPYNSKEYISRSIELTDRWLKRCVKRHSELTTPDSLPQALFAIVQGGEWQDLRIQSAKYCAAHDVPGFGIGGSFGGSFGDSKKNMHQVLEWVIPHLPDQKPRHLLGIGQLDDLFECVERGVDLFDCVIPTREARHKVVYTKFGKKIIRKMKTLEEPIAIDCKCIACDQKITWKQLYELFLARDPRAYFYTTVHNIQFFGDLMEEIREAIKKNTLIDLKNERLKNY